MTRGLIVSSIVKCYNKGFCLKEVSFDVKEGEIFGFLGENGAGKTTTLRAILGLLTIDSGKISFEGIKRDRIGFVLENETPFFNLTPVEYLDFFGDIYKMDKKDRKKRISDLLEEMELMDKAHEKIVTFSKGMKRKLTIAKALLHDPDILIMDEPFTGIEPLSRRRIKSLIRELANKNKIIIFSTHVLDEAETLCNTFGIIHNGKFLGKMKISEKQMSLEEIFFHKVKENKNV